MQDSLAKRVIARTRPGRTLFHYFKDRYAFLLLSWAAGRGVRISDLRGSRLRNLLQKPAVKNILAMAGKGELCSDQFLSHWPGIPYCYVLTLGRWGHESGSTRYNQTSRNGTNLVLQLNFTKSHDRLLARQVDADTRPNLAWTFHPVLTGRRNTIAWARIDYDEESGEALIEEIQSDWVRNAQWFYKCAQDDSEVGSGGLRRFRSYIDDTLAPHIGMWAEATLAATLQFLREDLNVNTVWYHTWEGGKFLKDCEPPYSIYESLPRRFCFERVRQVPDFLLRERGRSLRNRLREFDDRYEFWKLEMN